MKRDTGSRFTLSRLATAVDRLDHPYQNLSGGRWLRGNLHVHPRPKDDRQQAIDRYAELGYDFIALTEHDKFFSAQTFDSRGMVVFSGEEITEGGPHILHINASRHIAADSDRQLVLDAIAAGPGFAVLNHPNASEEFDHCPLTDMLKWKGYIGLEIFNGEAQKKSGSAYATDKWDRLLHAGRRVWGFACDDYHKPEHAGKAWTMVYAKERSKEAILKSLVAGRFYASTGVGITNIVVNDLHVRIETTNAQRISAIADCGKRIACADDRVIDLDVPRETRYVRFECWGAGETFAWTQPLFVRDAE